MNTIFYAIYDTAAAVYLKPWNVLSDAQAMREFTDLVTNPESTINKHPEDYYLCRIGRYNDRDGKLEPEAVETLLTGLEALAGANHKANEKQNNLDLVDANYGGSA